MTAEEIATPPEIRLGAALRWMVIVCSIVLVPTVAVLAETALAAGFCGYMAAGVRPNAYYRRRLPTA